MDELMESEAMLAASRPRLDRPLAIAVVRALVEELRARLSREPGLETRFLEGDDTVEQESLRTACALVGVETAEYQLALDADGNLAELHRCAITDGICGPTDPGPYDRISSDWPIALDR